jgi:large subunit ribosomal protein L1
MMKRSKRLREIDKNIDKNKYYNVKEAVEILKNFSPPKFDESVEIAVKLGVDPKKSDQQVRGSVMLPHGTGRKRKVLVFCKGDKEKEAKEAGADWIGAEELISKIQNGWLDFDVAIATPELMREVGKVGRILGPRGLMPSPKTGTVTKEVAKAVKEAKTGKLNFKMDKLGNVNVAVGKISFENEKLVENIHVFLEALSKAKPSQAKGNFIKKVFISATMSPGLKIDLNEISK